MKYIVLSLVGIAILGACAASAFIWHQPKTDECIA